jgi:hypothetical protein
VLPDLRVRSCTRKPYKGKTGQQGEFSGMQELKHAEEHTTNPVSPTLTAAERKARMREIKRTAYVFDGKRDAPLLASIMQILRDEKKPRWAERCWAVETLSRAHLTPEQRAEALPLLVKAAQPQSYLQRIATLRTFLSTAGVCSLTVLGVGLVAFWQRELSTFPDILLFFFLAILIGTVLGGPLIFLTFMSVYGYQMRQAAKVRRASLQALGRLEAMEGIGALLMAARVPKWKPWVEMPLIALLNKLTPAHYATLPVETVPALCDLISTEHRMSSKGGNEVWVLHLLDALGNVGDGRAVPFVSRLAQTAKNSAIREKAYDILPVLQARKQLEEGYSILLRPSQISTNPQTELLRAANAHTDAQPETLLRAVNSVEASDASSEK